MKPTPNLADRSHRSHPSAIVAERLVRQFDRRPAVDGIDLDIRKGEIYGFLGPNGAGKSTTVRVLCTLLAPSAGTATVAGYDVATQPDQVRLRIGVALQDVALDPKQTGTELLRLQGRLYGLTRTQVDARLDDLVTYVLEGQGSLVTHGWRWDRLGEAALAIGVVGLASMSLCFAALRGRTKRG